MRLLRVRVRDASIKHAVRIVSFLLVTEDTDVLNEPACTSSFSAGDIFSNVEVWVREIPGDIRPKLCAEVDDVAFKERRVAVSASTSTTAYAQQLVYQFQIRAAGGSYQAALEKMGYSKFGKNPNIKHHVGSKSHPKLLACTGEPR